MKPATERYVRSVVESNGIELVLGIAYTDAAEYFTLLSVSKQLLRDAVNSLSGSHAVTNPALLAEAVEAEVVKQWPGRYWFLEVCSAGDRDGWTQVFQPAPVSYNAGLGAVARKADELELRIKALEAAGAGLSDEQLSKRIERDFIEMLEEMPVEELRLYLRRKEMEMRQAKAELAPPIDVEAP